MALALHAEGLWKLYESGESVIQAVQDVSLSVESGAMVAIMGPSGCGKTTLLNVLSGIDEPNSGVVMVNGENLYASNDDERTRVRGKHMGFIFQEFNLLPVMTALENVELPLLIQGMSASDARKEALITGIFQFRDEINRGWSHSACKELLIDLDHHHLLLGGYMIGGNDFDFLSTFQSRKVSGQKTVV